MNHDQEMVLSFRQEQGDSITRRIATLTTGDKEITVDARLEFVDDPALPQPPNLDGFVLLVIFCCMERGGKLVVEGPVSRSIVRSLRYFQEAWIRWRPNRYRLVDIVPAAFADVTPKHDRAIAAFSGGIDSSFLALQHTSHDRGNAAYPLTDVMFGHGLDIPLEATDALLKAKERSREFLESVGLRMRIVRTNVRRFYPSNYEDVHGALICGLLHQFSHAFGHGLIASSNSYENLRMIWGSNPVVDHLMGSDSFSIVHDGAGYNRIEKLKRILENALATESLRVCWRDPSYCANCGSCEKCVLTQLEFLALGVSDPGCFSRPLDIRLIDAVTPGSPSRLRAYEWVLEVSEELGDKPWRNALKKRLRALRARRGLASLSVLLPDVFRNPNLR